MRIGIHLDQVPHRGLDPLGRAETAIGPIELVHWFQAWGGGYGQLRPDWLDAVAGSGRSGLITWEPWALSGETSQPAFAPASIVAGHHDPYLTSWASGFAARSDGPWFVRPMHEMNGSWYPWSGGIPGGDPGLYRAAWVHIRQLFQAAGVSNIAWVWCPLVDDVAGPFEAYYPGDEHVDVLALDGYNWGAGFPDYGGWRSPSDLFDDAYRRITALGPQSVWLAEVGCAPEGGDKAAWMAELLGLAHTRYDRLDAVVWFSLDKERDWRVDDDPAVAAAICASR